MMVKAIKIKSQLLCVLLCILTGCTATKLVQEYKNPDTVNYEASKVLVVGISVDTDLRRAYEKKVVEALEKENVIAVKSVDFFEKSFTNNSKSIEQLSAIETQLLEAGFDTILVTKVTGQESRVTLVDAYKNFGRKYQSFEDYYYGNQYLYFKEQEASYQVYTTETSLYCICPDKERELLWRGAIEVVDSNKVNQNMNGYITTLFKTLENHKILILS